MSWERRLLLLPLRFRSLFRRTIVEAELEEELRLHLECLTDSNVRKGMSPQQARYEALKAMQGFEQRKEECRDRRGVNWLETIARDVSYGLRMLRCSPVFTTVAVLSLALGIGANSAIFGLIDTLLLRPLPVPRAHELRSIYLKLPERPQPYLSYPVFDALRAHSSTLTPFAWAKRRFQMTSGDETVHVDGELASGNYFSTLGVAPTAGRVFSEADDHVSGGQDGPVAVISNRFWKHHYQGSQSAVGRGVVLDRIRFTVIGVMPAEFFGSEMGTSPDVWIPLSLAGRVGNSDCIANSSCWWLVLMGRMKPGITAQQVNTELNQISAAVLLDTTPPGWNAGWKKRYRSYVFSSQPGEQGWSFLRFQFTRPLLILMTLVGLLLLISCVNMANLLLARASARSREIAVRLAMGAGRTRIIRQLLTESVLLSFMGCLAGTFFAFWLTRILIAFVSAAQRHTPAQFTHLELHLDWRIVLFTLALTFASGLLFGLAPAFRSTRLDIAPSLKKSAPNVRGHASELHSGRVLVVVQTALSVLLVAAAGLFADSLFRLLTLNYGFNPDDVSLISVDTEKRTDNKTTLLALYDRILETASGIPGVTAASVVAYVPLSGGGWDERIQVPGKPDLPQSESDTFLNLIGPRFFEAMETRLRSGRRFDERDTTGAERVGIISDVAARRFFPGENAIGRHILLLGKPIRVVGVVEDIRYLSLRDTERPELYLPYTQNPDSLSSLTFIFKMRPGAPSSNEAFRKILHRLAPDVPISMTYSMHDQVDSSLGRERLMASLSLFFGILALLLTSIGLYGTLAYTVTRRTGEIGIRLALGAHRANVIWLMLRGAVTYVLTGILIGTLAVLAVSRAAPSLLYGMQPNGAVAGLLYGVQPNDPANLATAIAALLLVTALASFLPSLRASRVDPAVSLRQE